MSNVSIIVGAQWGDEGKGKWVDILAESCKLVVRFQGGNNAGHTLYVDGKKLVLHQIPSGILREDCFAALTAATVVNPVELVKEIETLSGIVSVQPERLWLSARAQVISPYHIHLDGQREQQSEIPIGTTKRGIGPTYASKANRDGLRLGTFVHKEQRQAWMQSMAAKDPQFKSHLKDFADQWLAFEQAAASLSNFVCDGEERVRQVIESGAEVLMEGAQGALLDIDHGTYPFVTSSSTAAGGALASVGFSPKRVKTILGVAKAYTTRVGSGAFPSEDHGADGRKMADQGHEFGATTGRPRRCGWLDVVALRYAFRSSGMDGVILNKMDILDNFERIKLCVAYQHPKLGVLKDFPYDHSILEQVEPVYEEMPGWMSPLPDSGSIANIPEAAQSYISRIEELIGGPVTMVGTGVNRHNALFR